MRGDRHDQFRTHIDQAQGAVPVLVVVLVAAIGAACSTLPPRNKAERATDSAIAARVQAALRADPQLDADHIRVAVRRGAVDLEGLVFTGDDMLRAQDDAESVAGVKTVNDTVLQIVDSGP